MTGQVYDDDFVELVPCDKKDRPGGDGQFSPKGLRTCYSVLHLRVEKSSQSREDVKTLLTVHRYQDACQDKEKKKQCHRKPDSQESCEWK